MKNLLQSALCGNPAKFLFLGTPEVSSEVVNEQREISPEEQEKINKEGTNAFNQTDILNVLVNDAKIKDVASKMHNSVQGKDGLVARAGEVQVEGISTDLSNFIQNKTDLVKYDENNFHLIKTDYIKQIDYVDKDGEVFFSGQEIKDPNGKSFIRFMPEGIVYAGNDGIEKSISTKGSVGMIGDKDMDSYEDYSEELAPMYIEMQNIISNINKEQIAANTHVSSKQDKEVYATR